MLKKEKDLMLFGLAPYESSFKGLFLFLFVYIGASLFAAILTGPIYNLVLFCDAHWSSSTTKWFVGYEIDTYYDRLRWIPIIIGLPWVMKKCGLFSARNIGIKINVPSMFVFFCSFVLGLLLACVIYAIQIAFGVYELKSGLDFSEVLKILGGAFAGAVIVAFLEEIVFRCLILRSLYTAFGVLSSMILTSLFFAYKHFKVPDNIVRDLLPGGAHSSHWDIGWYVAYYDTIGISLNFNLTIFVGLFMFGMVLALIYLKTRVLWGAIALHVGLVFAMLSQGKLFKQSGEVSDFLGGGQMTNGWLATIVLAIMFIALLCWKSDKKA